jgi:hypothetical protein
MKRAFANSSSYRSHRGAGCFCGPCRGAGGAVDDAVPLGSFRSGSPSNGLSKSGGHPGEAAGLSCASGGTPHSGRKLSHASSGASIPSGTGGRERAGVKPKALLLDHRRPTLDGLEYDGFRSLHNFQIAALVQTKPVTLTVSAGLAQRHSWQLHALNARLEPLILKIGQADWGVRHANCPGGHFLPPNQVCSASID